MKPVTSTKLEKSKLTGTLLMLLRMKECSCGLVQTDEIAYWQSRFRVLSGWEIEFDKDADYKDQCCINTDTRHATIYGWSGLTPQPADYVFHEMLHVAIRAAGIVLEDGEEWLVQDLCELFRELVTGRAKGNETKRLIISPPTKSLNPVGSSLR